MIVTFPHMGNLHIILKTLLTAMGQNIHVPPPISKKTVQLGVRHSPETVCLPFKMMLGNFIEALEQGATTVLTCGGIGPCRLGCYAQVQQGILEHMGYQFEMLVVEPRFSEAVGITRRLSQGKSWRAVYGAFRLAGLKMMALDDWEGRTAFLRPREVLKGAADRIKDLGQLAIDQADSEMVVRQVWRDTTARLESLAVNDQLQPIRIGLVGEIYVMLEPFANQHLEKRLGMLGVEVHKTMQLSDYVQGHIFRSREQTQIYRLLDQMAKPYLGHYVGGHGLKTIAYTVQKCQQGLDGIIQVYPFTCMPEAIARNILPQVSRDTGMPVLSLAYDEHSGEAGLVTRLEAFVDLLTYRRSAQKGELI